MYSFPRRKFSCQQFHWALGKRCIPRLPNAVTFCIIDDAILNCICFLSFPPQFFPTVLVGQFELFGRNSSNRCTPQPIKIYSVYMLHQKSSKKNRAPKFLPRCDPTRCVTLATCWLLSSTVDTDCHVAIDVVFPALSAPSHVDLWGWPCQVTSSGKKPSQPSPKWLPKKATKILQMKTTSLQESWNT